MFFLLIHFLNKFLFSITKNISDFFYYYSNFFNFFFFFLKKNEMIWQEGLLIDFLQKKSFNLWSKKFLILSSYFFNEKNIFDKIIKYFINNFIEPMKEISVFEHNSISNFFFINIFYYFLLFFTLLFVILFLL